MKFFLSLIVIIFLIMTSLYYFKPTLFQSIQTTITTNLSNISTQDAIPKKTTIYKWTDSNGILQVSNNPPAIGIKYKVEQLQHSKNIMPSEVLTGKQSK